MTVIKEPTDAPVRVTASCIRGSDLHPCHSVPSDQGPAVFDRTSGLDEVPAGYRAMDEREALKVMVTG